MNEQNNLKQRPNTEQAPVTCQFYIVLGNYEEIEFRNDERKRFFPLKANYDAGLVQYALGEEWKKKKKDNINVASEIIFIIPDLSYEELAQNVMDKLNCRGKFQIVPIPKKEEPKEVQQPVQQPAQEPVKQPVLKQPIITENNPTPQVREEKISPIAPTIKGETTASIPIKNQEKELEIKSPTEKPAYKPIAGDNVFHKEIEFPSIKKQPVANEQSVEDYMWGDSLNKKSNSKKLVRAKSNGINGKNGFIDLPVIIFILSTLFLIGSIILLFVLK